MASNYRGPKEYAPRVMPETVKIIREDGTWMEIILSNMSLNYDNNGHTEIELKGYLASQSHDGQPFQEKVASGKVVRRPKSTSSIG